MIVFAVPRSGDELVFNVVALYDMTLNTEQLSIADMTGYVRSAIPNDAIIGNIYEFNYSYELKFVHNGENFNPDVFKQTFNVRVFNPDALFREFIKLTIPKDSQTLSGLSDTAKLITDNKTQFPRIKIFVPDYNGKIFSREGVVFHTVYEPGDKFLDSVCEIKGAHFDDVVTRLDFSFRLTNKEPLLEQIFDKIDKAGYGLNWDLPFDYKINTSRYYPPAPLTKILANICQDNFLTFAINENIISIKKIDENNDIQSPSEGIYFSFANTIPGSVLMESQNFKIENYSNVNFRSEIADLKLFMSIYVGNDSGDDKAFDTFSKANFLIGTTFLYRFYILSYSILYSRKGLFMDIVATNNWLLQNIKLDSFLENKIYQ